MTLTTSNKIGLKNLIAGLVLGGGATFAVEEYRKDKSEQALVEKMNAITSHASPIVSAAAMEANLPNLPWANRSQTFDPNFTTKVAVEAHAVNYLQALNAANGIEIKIKE